MPQSSTHELVGRVAGVSGLAGRIETCCVPFGRGGICASVGVTVAKARIARLDKRYRLRVALKPGCENIVSPPTRARLVRRMNVVQAVCRLVSLLIAATFKL